MLDKWTGVIFRSTLMNNEWNVIKVRKQRHNNNINAGKALHVLQPPIQNMFLSNEKVPCTEI